MLRLTGIVGQAADPEIGERLHELSHGGRVEYLVLGREEMSRHRLRTRTDRGTECAIALPRSQHLANGAVLLLEAQRAVVVRMKDQAWLPLLPRDAAAALELGYFAGNMHWRVRFDGTTLDIALDDSEESYLARLAPLLADGRVKRSDDD